MWEFEEQKLNPLSLQFMIGSILNDTEQTINKLPQLENSGVKPSEEQNEPHDPTKL